MSSGGRISLDIHRSCCEARSNLSFLVRPNLNTRNRHTQRAHCAALAFLLSLRACEAISLFCLSAPDNRDRHVPRDDRKATLVMTYLVCHCEGRSNLAFLVRPNLNTRDRPEGTLRCARPPTVIASLRSNLSFLVRPTLNTRDRHVPRDDRSLCHCEARSNLAFWFASLEQPRSPYPEGTLRCARDDRRATLAMT